MITSRYHDLYSHSYSFQIYLSSLCLIHPSLYVPCTDLSVNLDNAEQEAIERELALSSSVTVSTSKIDCLEKILEESQAQRALSDSKCLEEYTSLCMQIGVLENEVEESKAAILKLEARVFILQEEKQEAKEILEEYKQKAVEKEKTVNAQMKVLLMERKTLETELGQSQEHMMEADRASKSNYLAVSDQRDKLEMQLKVAKAQATAAADEIKALKGRLDSVSRQAAEEKAALVAGHEAKMKIMREEEERKLEALADEVSESFLVEIQSLNEELTTANDNLSSSQLEYEASQLANSGLEDELREAESFGEQERHRHENQIIQLLKIVGIYDSSVDPLDESWVHLFRLQMDEERIKIMTLKNCLMRFTNKLTTVDNGLLRGAGIILVGNVPDA
jgi:DNA repair exonuclease SbcCD ATPase subunit